MLVLWLLVAFVAGVVASPFILMAIASLLDDGSPAPSEYPCE